MEERNPYLNPHFRKQIQQPDAPEPGNRARNATDILLQPNITHMRQQRDGYQNFFFSPRGSGMRQQEAGLLRMMFGPGVLGPFPPGVSTLTPPNPFPPDPNAAAPNNDSDDDDE
jgi:hypothetical protein